MSSSVRFEQRALPGWKGSCYVPWRRAVKAQLAAKEVSPMRTLRVAAAWLAIPALMTVIACSTNPATVHSQLNMYSQGQEIQLGQQYDQQVRQQIGTHQHVDLHEDI